MSNTMEYKGYVGSVEFSEEDAIFYGKVLGIRALVSYEGESAHDLVADFHGAVDDYLAQCEAEGIEPPKAYKCIFNNIFCGLSEIQNRFLNINYLVNP